jgi:hypothetical protein
MLIVNILFRKGEYTFGKELYLLSTSRSLLVIISKLIRLPLSRFTNTLYTLAIVFKVV